MIIDQVVRNICFLPQDFNNRGDISMVKLLENSGYIENRELISLTFRAFEITLLSI